MNFRFISPFAFFTALFYVTSFFSFTMLFSFLNCSSTSEKSAAKPKPQGTVVNYGIYLVGSHVITHQDMRSMQKRLRHLGIKRKVKKKALEFLVENAIVDISAEKDAVYITEDQVQTEAEKHRTAKGLSPKRFQKAVERETGLAYNEWLKELRHKMLKRQLIQIKIYTSPPALSEMKAFYRKNKKRIGIELRYRALSLRPKNKSIEEEVRISRIAKEIYTKLLNSPEKFREIARKHSHRYSGRLRPYESIYDIARKNQLLASSLYQIPLGRISRPFRDSIGRYVIAKVEKRRPLPFSKAKPLILHKLYAEKEKTAFDKWIKKRKKEITFQDLQKKH